MIERDVKTIWEKFKTIIDSEANNDKKKRMWNINDVLRK
jgi:hypothetical protein